MNVGMLWFDNDLRMSLDGKVARAADFYSTKYGRKPTLCFVHPSMLSGQTQNSAPLSVGGVEVRSNRSVMPNHFWIGVNTAEGK